MAELPPRQRALLAAAFVAGGTIGRIAFGIGAVLCAAAALYLWKRLAFPPPARDDLRPPAG